MKKIYRREKKRCLLCVWLLIVSGTVIHAQTTQTPTIQWQRLLGTAYVDYPARVVRASTSGFAVLYGNVIRLSESGDTIWERTIPESPEYPGRSNIVTFIATASDDGFGVLTYNEYKWSLVRLNADGSVRWLKSFENNPARNALARLTFTGLTYTIDGGFLATASSSYPRQGSYAILYKFDSAGNNTISARLNVDNLNQSQPVTKASRIVQATDGNYLLVGASSDPALNYTTTPIGWVVKLD